MANGIVQVPIEKGRKMLCWNVGQAVEAGTNDQNPIVSLRIDKDADFVAKRAWLVQWPSFGGGIDYKLSLPTSASVTLRDGATKYPLSLTGGQAGSIISDLDTVKASYWQLGLTTPWMIRKNSNVFAEVANPNAQNVAWVGDLILALEGFSIYPDQQELVPPTLEAYALPDYGINSTFSVTDPSIAGAGTQYGKITNAGLGRVLIKGLRIRVTDANLADQTENVLATMGLNISDSTSGKMPWVRNAQAASGIEVLPAGIMNYRNTFIRFAQPRLIDENANLNVTMFFHPAALAYLHGLNWPMQVSFNLVGDMLPK